MITLIILGVGTIMLVASILFAPRAEPAQEALQPASEPAPGKLSSDSSSVDLSDTVSTAIPPQSRPQSPAAEKPSADTSESRTDKTTAAQEAPASPEADIITIEVKKSETEKESQKPAVTVTPASDGAKLVFVFDDAGHNLNQLKPFLELPFDCVIAVLPALPHSGDAASAAREAGKQVILHQPMQAVNLSTDPGPSAIKPDMHTYEIEALVKKNLAEVGPVSGVNNHEGSLITATQSAIGAVLDVCKEEGIFFLDSRTNAETKAPLAARERGMTIYERDIFLDNTQSREDIIAMINKGLAVADKKGHAIMIGHIWSDGLAAIIEELYPQLLAKGYVFTDLSGLD
ncbi:MAG: divergent polysaccharide deacetylase family protein [Treponemataceae bacterium]|nr:divergent polysaccharide deacetylase family protein [Treponemataceae bacterium]